MINRFQFCESPLSDYSLVSWWVLKRIIVELKNNFDVECVMSLNGDLFNVDVNVATYGACTKNSVNTIKNVSKYTCCSY